MDPEFGDKWRRAIDAQVAYAMRRKNVGKRFSRNVRDYRTAIIWC